jgi:hypothetical protein
VAGHVTVLAQDAISIPERAPYLGAVAGCVGARQDSLGRIGNKEFREVAELIVSPISPLSLSATSWSNQPRLAAEQSVNDIYPLYVLDFLSRITFHLGVALRLRGW